MTQLAALEIHIVGILMHDDSLFSSWVFFVYRILDAINVEAEQLR